MAKEDWDLAPNGDIALSPLVGYAVAEAKILVIAQLHTAHLTEEPTKPEVRRVQLGMTVEQARELGQALSNAADRVDRGLASA